MAELLLIIYMHVNLESANTKNKWLEQFIFWFEHKHMRKIIWKLETHVIETGARSSQWQPFHFFQVKGTSFFLRSFLIFFYNNVLYLSMIDCIAHVTYTVKFCFKKRTIYMSFYTMKDFLFRLSNRRCEPLKYQKLLQKKLEPVSNKLSFLLLWS